MLHYSVRTIRQQAKHCSATQGQGPGCKALCKALKTDSTTSARSKWGSHWKKSSRELVGTAAKPGPTLMSASTIDPAAPQRRVSWLQGHGKAGGITVPSYWERACSRSRCRMSNKGWKQSIIQKCWSSKRLLFLLKDYCSSFWPPPKPDVTAQETTLSISVFLRTVIEKQSFFPAHPPHPPPFFFSFFFFYLIPGRDQKLISFRRDWTAGLSAL